MFFGGEDDDDSFTPSGGGSSKLASLFGIDGTRSGNTSLTYTAPTEPKKKKQVESTEGQEVTNTAVLHAVAVTAYKLVDGNFTSQGKLGAAIIGNHSESSYKLLLYVSKQQQITHVDINVNFHFAIQPSNYANFYDSARQNWSVLFESAKQLVEFARQIAITRVNSAAGSLGALVSQDLGLGDGEALEHGDSVEVKYTGWLWTDHGPGQVFDTNSNSEKLFRFRLGKGKVIKGWDEGLLGMKKGSSRLLIVPPSLAYGAEGKSPKIPPGSTLVFEIDVVRVKLAKEKEPMPLTSQPPSVPQPDTESEAADGVKARSKSISEQLEHNESPKTDKAKLISRMAKMGQPMLPGIIAAAPGQSGSDPDPETAHTGTSPSPCASPKPVLAAKPVFSASAHSTVTAVQSPVTSSHPSMTSAHTAAPVAQPLQPTAGQHPMLAHVHPEQVSQMALYQPLSMPQPGYPPGMMTGSVPYLPPNPMYPTPPYTGVSSEVTVMMSESRQQNTEVRLAVGHIGDKLDRLTEKIDRLDKGPANAVAVMGAFPNMETDILLHNLQRIIQENDRLKKEVAERTTKAETQNDKISELLQRNQRLMEQNNAFLEKSSNTFEASATQSQARIQGLEKEKALLATQLGTATAQVELLQTTVTWLKTRELELDQQVAALHDTEWKQKKDLEDVTLRLAESEKTLADVRRDTERETQGHSEQEGAQLQEELRQTRAASESLEQRLTDLKRQSVEEQKQLEENMEKLKTQHEKEVSSLKEKIQKQTVPSDSSSAQQVAQAEQKLAKEWQEKCDQLVSSATKKHQRELEEWRMEKQQLEERMKTIERKYANLRTRAGEMKVHYEDLLAQEREAGSGGDPQTVVSEVKKIMNSVYQTLRAEFASEKSYAGTDIHSTILHAIKTVTLQLVERQRAQGEEDEASDEDDQDESDGEDGEKGDEECDENDTVECNENGDEEGNVEGKYSGGEMEQPKDLYREAVTQVVTQTVTRRLSCDKPDDDKKFDSKVTRSDGDTDGTAEPDVNVADGTEENENTEHEGGTTETSAATSVVTAYQANERGNQQTMEEKIEAMMAPETSHKPSKSKTLEDQIEAVGSHGVKGKTSLEDSIEAMICEGSTKMKAGDHVEETVRAVAASVTGGGGGNPHYAAELKDAGKPPAVDVIQRVVAPHTGNHGNPYYAAELAAGQPQEDIEPVVTAKVTSQLAGKAPGKEQVKPKTGGGDPHNLSQLGVEGMEGKVQRDVEPVVAAKVSSTTAGKAPGKGQIKAVIAAVTGGGGGNPHYAAELEKAGKDQSKDLGDVIKPVVAMATGDRGNRHYAAELASAHQRDNTGPSAGKTDKGKNPVKNDETKDSSKHSGSKMADDKMDAVFAGIADAMEDTGKTAEKKSKKAASKEQLKQESVLAATDALFSDPFFDSSLPETDTTSRKKTKKSQSDKSGHGKDEDLAARLGIISSSGGKTKASKDTAGKPTSENTHSDDDLKPRPPPQPLFGDDDDDDLDWLK